MDNLLKLGFFFLILIKRLEYTESSNNVDNLFVESIIYF